MSPHCQRRVDFTVGVAERRGWAQRETSGTWLFDLPLERDRPEAWAELLERICEDANDAFEQGGHEVFVRLFPGWRVGPVVVAPGAGSAAERLGVAPSGWAPSVYGVDAGGRYWAMPVDTFVEVLRLQVEAPLGERLRALREGPPPGDGRRPPRAVRVADVPARSEPPAAIVAAPPEGEPPVARPRVVVPGDSPHWAWVRSIERVVAAEASARELLAHGESEAGPFIGLRPWPARDLGRVDARIDDRIGALERDLGLELPPSLVSFHRSWRAGAPTRRAFLWDLDRIRSLALASEAERPAHFRSLPAGLVVVGEADAASLALDRAAAFDPASGARRAAELPVCRYDPERSEASSRRVVAPTLERFVLDQVREVLRDAAPEVRAEPWWGALDAELAARAEAIAREVAANGWLVAVPAPATDAKGAPPAEAPTALASAPPRPVGAAEAAVAFVARRVDLRLVRFAASGAREEWRPAWFFILPARRDTPEGWRELLARLCDNWRDAQARHRAAPDRFEVHDVAVAPIDYRSIFDLRLDPDGDDDLDALFAVAPWYRGDFGATSPLSECWIVDAEGYVASRDGSGFSLELLYGAVADGALDEAGLARGLAAMYPESEQAARHFESRAERIARARQVDALDRARQRRPG